MTAWEELERTVLDDLVVRTESSEPLRIWVPGCSTGEEAYSVAMLAEECLQRSGKVITVIIDAEQPRGKDNAER